MARRKLILLGAGDFAREVLWSINQIPHERRDWDIAGLLDDNPTKASQSLQRYGVDVPVLGTIQDYQPLPGDCFLPAIGSAKGKLAIGELLAQRGAEFINVIHPTAAIAPTAVLGVGLFIWRHTTVSVQVRIGNFVTMLPSSIAGHDAVIGDGCTLCAHCDVNGHAHLERGVFLGSQAVILPNAHVGEFATVGAGSVVLKRVQPGQTVFGVPAKEL